MDQKWLKIECKNCKTIFDAVQMPVAVNDIERLIKAASCPTCDAGAWNGFVCIGEN